MKFITELTNVKQPELKLPEGYTIREATGDVKDITSWSTIVGTFRRGVPYPDGEGDKVWFADYHGEPVGCESVKLPGEPSDRVLMSTGVILPEHQKKGLHNAITYYRLKYARETGRQYVRVACRETLDNWWRRHLINEPNT